MNYNFLTLISPTVPIYVAYTNWSLRETEMFLRHLNAGKVGPLRFDRSADKTLTDRIIIVMEPAVFKKYEESRTYGIKIMPYVIKNGLIASPDSKRNQTYDFFIPVPRTINGAEIVRDRLQELAAFGYPSKFTIHSETSNLRISFPDSISRHDIITLKIVLHDSFWDYRGQLLQCYWHCIDHKKTSVKPVHFISNNRFTPLDE